MDVAAWELISNNFSVVLQGIVVARMIPKVATQAAAATLNAIAVSSIRLIAILSCEPDAIEARVAEACATPSSINAKNIGMLVSTNHSPYCLTPQAARKNGTTTIWATMVAPCE